MLGSMIAKPEKFKTRKLVGIRQLDTCLLFPTAFCLLPSAYLGMEG